MKTSLKANPWPYAIIGWFVLFVSGLAVWAIVAVRQNMDLVRPDYYEAEIRYQQQIERLKRTSSLRSEISITHDSLRHRLALQLPTGRGAAPAEGTIRFYRPSDARLDFELKLALDAGGNQHIDTTHLQPGFWKVRILWSVGAEEFYFDQPVVL